MLGVVDELADSIEASAKEADLIFIATPVQETERILDLFATFN